MRLELHFTVTFRVRFYRVMVRAGLGFRVRVTIDRGDWG